MLEIYIDGSFEPTRTELPLDSVFMNMNAALNNNVHYFTVDTPGGGREAVRVERVTKIRELVTAGADE